MILNVYTCPICNKRRNANIDHSACKPKLDKLAESHKKKKRRCFPAQKYMEHLRICGAID